MSAGPAMSDRVINLGGRYGGVTVVDGQDYKELSQYRWSSVPNRRGTLYARGWVKGQYILLHRFLLGLQPGDRGGDHRDGDSLNNRRSNLRPATATQNSFNTRKRAGCRSSYKGVTWHKGHKCWQARLSIAGTECHLGYFAEEEEAARAYDKAARAEAGEFARLNFPEEKQ